MGYILRDNLKRKTIEAFDQDHNIVGEAVFSPFIPSDLYDNPRLNIYFDIKVLVQSDKENIRNQLFDEIIHRARELKLNYLDFDVKVYHCCFSDDIENIEYYSSKPGFSHDEGMYIIKKDITEQEFTNQGLVEDDKLIKNDQNITYVKLTFQTKDEMLQLILEQHKVFKNGYSIDDLIAIKSAEQWLSLAAIQNGIIIGNIIMIVKEDENNNKYGWVDDFFVSKEWRREGIGKNLLEIALYELKLMGINESRLEVWSSNVRAMSLYKNFGFHFYKETECAIGMFL